MLQFPTSKKTHCISITKANFTEKISVYSENHILPVNTRGGLNGESLNVITAGVIVASVL